MTIQIRERLLKNSRNASSGDCRNWTRHKNNAGYGVVGICGKNALAHRIAYSVFKGRIPAGLNVLHKCDNRSCINPDHLIVGTQADNMRDCSRKGRLRIVHGRNIGEINGRSKLSNAQVSNIRELLTEGHATQQEIANQFSVDQSTVSDIKRGKSRRRA